MINFRKNISPVLQFICVSLIFFVTIGGISYAITGDKWPAAREDRLTEMNINGLHVWAVSGPAFTNGEDATANFIYHVGKAAIGALANSPGLILDVEEKAGGARYCDQDGNNCANPSGLESGFLANITGWPSIAGSLVDHDIEYGNPKQYDFNNEFDIASGVFTATANGNYFATAHFSLCQLKTGAGALAKITLYKNGFAYISDYSHADDIQGGTPCAFLKLSATLKLSAGDTLQIKIKYWDSDDFANYSSGGATLHWFNVIKVSAWYPPGETLGDPCVVGEGVCVNSGNMVCDSNSSCSAICGASPLAPPEPGNEVSCDGLDNDCDGEVDETSVCTAHASCVSGGCVCDSGYHFSGSNCVPNCTDTCASLGYCCGTRTVCGVATNCGNCTNEIINCNYNTGSSVCRTSIGCLSENDGIWDNANGLINGIFKNGVVATCLEINSNVGSWSLPINPCIGIGGYGSQYNVSYR